MSVIILASAALAGIVGGCLWHVEPTRLFGACGVAALGACLGWRQPRWRMLALVACASGLGAVRASMVPGMQPGNALEPYLGSRVRLRAYVAEVPKLVGGGYARLVLGVEALGPPGRGPVPLQPSLPDRGAATPPRVLVLADPATPIAGFNVGEHLSVEGRLATAADARGPPVLWSAQVVEDPPAPGQVEPHAPKMGETPSSHGLAALVHALEGMRAAAAANVQGYLPEPQASLAVGVLLGGGGQLSLDFKLDLQRSGLTHLLAIDGYKAVRVAALASAVVVRVFGVRVATLTTVVLISGYTLLTGAHPSAVRAALMIGLASVATLGGRVADPLTSLSLVVLALALAEPPILFDVGLQLSVSATLGIILLWPRLRRRLHRLPRWLAEPLGLSAAVTLATLPVTLSTFHFVSLVSPIAHVAAIPLLPLVLVSTSVLAAVAALPPPSALLAQLEAFTNATAAHTGLLPPLAALINASMTHVGSPSPPAVSASAAAAAVLNAFGWLPSLAAPVTWLTWLNHAPIHLPSLVLLVAWLVWVPTTLLAWVVHAFGSMPAAGISTGRLPPPAAAALAAALLAYGVWQLPELAHLRLAARRWQSHHPRLLAPTALAAACITAAALLNLVRPDGQVHVQPLRLNRGQAVFVRGPSGSTMLVVGGQPSASSLATEVAQNLAVWEHQLNLVVALDENAHAALAQTLARYPADQLLNSPHPKTPLRLEIGRGAAVDVWTARGQLRVAIDETTSAPTTSAARPGSAN